MQKCVWTGMAGIQGARSEWCKLGSRGRHVDT